MCLACPSICVCGTYVCTCMCARVEAFSDWLAINFSFICCAFLFILFMQHCVFSALTLLVGRHEEHPACKN